MYSNYQQNRVSRSVNTVHTNLFAKNLKLHKFATTFSRSVNTVHTNLFAKNLKLHKFATTNSNF